MKVCFVDPKGMHFGLNTGLGYIAAYLKKVHGSSVKTILLLWMNMTVWLETYLTF